MISTEETRKIDKGIFTLNIIWGAMLLSLLIYLFVGLYASKDIHMDMEKNLVGILRNILYAVSLVTLIATRFVKKLVLSGQIKSNVSSVNRMSYRSGQSLVLTRYTSALVTSLTMAESIGIYGLVLFFLGKNRLDLYSFILISAVAMLFYRPRREEIVDMAEEMERQTADRR